MGGMPTGGRLVPGSSGSMVWQKDALAPANDPMAAPKPAPMPGASSAPGSPSMFSGSPLNDMTAGLGRPLDAAASPLGMPSSYGSSNSNSPLNDPTAGLGRPLEFGGYRAKGGPVVPGRAYIVGERGPELIVPQMPGQVVPNGGSRIAQSPMNASYAPGSIASRPVRQIGRSMNDPARATEMAARYLRSQGDRAGAVRMLQNGALLNARINDQPDMPRAPIMTPMPAMAQPAQGRLVPGRSAGSMVWQQDQPPMPPMGMSEALPMNARPAPMPPPISMPAPEPAPVNPFEMTPLGGYVDPQFGMVPSGFKAMNERLALDPTGFPGLPMPPPGLYGPEAAPRVDVARLPGTDYVAPIFDGKVSAQTLPMAKAPEPLTFDPVPGTDLMMPRGQGADRLPMMQNRGTIEGPRPSPDTIGPMPGMPNLQPVGPSGSQKPAPMPKFQTDDEGRYFYFEPNGQGGFRRKFVDADGDGKPDVAPGAGGAKPAAPPVPTSSGKFTFSLGE